MKCSYTPERTNVRGGGSGGGRTDAPAETKRENGGGSGEGCKSRHVKTTGSFEEPPSYGRDGGVKPGGRKGSRRQNLQKLILEILPAQQKRPPFPHFPYFIHGPLASGGSERRLRAAARHVYERCADETDRSEDMLKISVLKVTVPSTLIHSHRKGELQTVHID
ncbi:hypothetical protein EYF80_036885 [Liparis tanakae]|uniref:Uncharacterized protein n=1 Tax=Liparis tanakae TaxID=230148 RepID=A0A4Z2GJF6_9TELE|nr:hypothetical protein EYF80_036885 [Liparis tanakae]